MTANVILPQGGSGRTTYVAKEVTAGIPPTGAAWGILRNTGGDGTRPEIETIESAELSGTQLGLRDIIRTEVRGVFDYDIELSKNDVYDTMFESLLEGTFQANVLVPGQTVTTMTVEDWLPDISTGVVSSGCRATSLSLSLDANQLITGTWTGNGTSSGLSPTVQQTHDSDGAMSFDSSGVLTLATTAPTWVGVGDRILVNGFDADDGYYDILAVGGTTITVDGITTGGASQVGAAVRFYSQSVVEANSGTVTPVDTSQLMRCGDYIELSINGSDVLDYGFRVPSMTVAIENLVENLLEITMDSPYTVLTTDRTFAMSISYHVINLLPVEFLLNDQEFSMRLRIANADGGFYELEWPRCKSQNAVPGGASRGEVMTGTWDVVALLNDAGETIKVTRSS